MSGQGVTAMFERLGRFVVRFRAPIVGFWILAAVAAVAGLPSLGSEVNSNNSQFLPASAPSSRAARRAAPILGRPGNQSQIMIVAARPGAPLTSADRAATARELHATTRLRGVVAAREAAVSPDGRAMQILVRAAVAQQDVSAQQPIIDALRSTLSRVSTPVGLRLHLAGAVATNVANQASSRKAMGTIMMLSLLLTIVVLASVFRAPLAAITTLSTSGLALLVSTRLIGWLGTHGLQISDITQTLLIVLVLGAGTDYGLFLVFRVREELRDGRHPEEAVARAIARVGESITASAGTVILALLTLLLASFALYRDLAVPLAVGIAVMLAMGLTLLPALLAMLGGAVFYLARIESGQHTAGAWGAVAARVVQRPVLTLAAGSILLLGAGAFALGFRPATFGGATSAPGGSDAAAGNALLASYFPQSSMDPANLVLQYRTPAWHDPLALARAERTLRSSHRFTRLTGPLDAGGAPLAPSAFARLYAQLGAPAVLPASPLAGARIPPAEYDAYRASAPYISPDGHTVQFEATLAAGDQQSTEAMNQTPEIRVLLADAAAASGASASGLAGQAASLYDISSTASSDMIRIVPLAIAAIGLLLALVLRSLFAPLYLIVSVVLSYLAALGVTTLAFIDIGGQAGISFFLPLLMFVFLLALGEDYNILVMTRIREEARRLPLTDAVVRALARTGSTITAAGVILAGTFAMFAIAGGAMGGQLRSIGVGLAVGILIDTFLVRTLLVPATVILLGRLNWWPSPPARQHEPSPRPARRASKPLPAGHGTP